MMNAPALVIDCGTCPVRGSACADCMVTALSRMAPAAELPLDAREQRAVDLLLQMGMISQDTASSATAQRESWGAYRDVG